MTTDSIQSAESHVLFVRIGEQYCARLSEYLWHLSTRPHDKGILAELHRAAHNLRGGAILVERARISVLAEHLEQAFSFAIEDKLVISRQEVPFLQLLIAEIRRELREMEKN